MIGVGYDWFDVIEMRLTFFIDLLFYPYMLSSLDKRERERF